MRSQTVSWATNGSGAATVMGSSVPGGSKLFALVYLPGSTDTGATVTVTWESNFSKAILTKASAGTSNVVYYPRDLVHKVEDGAALTGTAGADREPPLIIGYPKIVIASGGDTKAGSIQFYYE